MIVAKSFCADRAKKKKEKIFTDWSVLPHFKFVLTYVKTLLNIENIKVLKQ